MPSSKEKARDEKEYFRVESDFGYSLSKKEFVWENIDELGKYKKGTREFNLGFPLKWYENIPHISLNKVAKREPLDIFNFDGGWLISQKLKRVLENFDADAFDFLPTKTTYGKGLEEGEAYWLCDVIRVLDCVDEAASEIRYQQNISWKSYETIIRASMKYDVVQNYHLFRILYKPSFVCVDNVFMDLMHKNDVIGFIFTCLDGSMRAVK